MVYQQLYDTKIRILVIEDHPETANAIKTWISTASHEMRVIGIAPTIEAGIEVAQRHHPDVILLSMRLSGVDGVQATRMLVMDVASRVILLSNEANRDANEQAMQQALRVGARGFLTKPWTPEELLARIRQVSREPIHLGEGGAPARIEGTNTDRRRGRHVIAVCGAKGGVGRTMLAANLAVAFTGLVERVMLVDANLASGDAHIFFNFDNTTNTIEHLRQQSELDFHTVQNIALHHESKVDLLRAPDNVKEAYQFRLETIRTIICEVQEHYDVVIIDADSGFSDATCAAMKLADRILVVTTPEMTSVNRVKHFLDTATQELAIPNERCWLVCNRSDGGYQIRTAHIERSLQRTFAATLPDDVRTVVRSINHGKPFVMTQRRPPIARSVVTLAKKLHQHLARGPAPIEPRRSLLPVSR